MAKITAILTVYNMESCLQACLDSVVAQTYGDFEALCVNDGSTDGSLAILEAMAERDPRFKILTCENGGVAKARNWGIKEATGEYLFILDSDDVFDPTFFQKMLERAEASNADVVVCGSCGLDDRTGETYPTPWVLKRNYLPAKDAFAPEECDCLFMALMGWPWDKLYRRSFVLEQGLEFPCLANSEDAYFVYLALAKAQTVAVVDEELIQHRENRSGSVSNSRLRAPEAFYEVTVMLKNSLKELPSYGRHEWGFLNWAFDYACWNVLSLPEGSEGRALIARKLAEGGFPELEIDRHVKEYFNLYPDLIERYQRIQNEVNKVKAAETGEPAPAPERGSFWVKCARMCYRIDELGLGGAFKALLRR